MAKHGMSRGNFQLKERMVRWTLQCVDCTCSALPLVPAIGKGQVVVRHAERIKLATTNHRHLAFFIEVASLS